jgi:hypothetical protein
MSNTLSAIMQREFPLSPVEGLNSAEIINAYQGNEKLVGKSQYQYAITSILPTIHRY